MRAHLGAQGRALNSRRDRGAEARTVSDGRKNPPAAYVEGRLHAHLGRVLDLLQLIGIVGQVHRIEDAGEDQETHEPEFDRCYAADVANEGWAGISPASGH